jgi:Contractile injection system tube protein
MPLNSNNSEKLTITAFKDGKRSLTAGKIGEFEAMFNPDTVIRRFENHYRRIQSLNSGGGPVSFAFTKHEQIDLTILIDGTSLGAALSSKSVSISPLVQNVDVTKQVESFRSLAFSINGNIHQPNFLKLTMGTALEEVACRLTGYTLEYSNFDDNGNPNRAEIKATFITDTDSFKQKAVTSRKSADLTHIRTVISGDTLPLLSKAIYDTPGDYIKLARINNLDHFRKLKPGTQLVFPPKTKED